MTVRGVFNLSGLEQYLEALHQKGADLDTAAADAVLAAGDALVADMLERVPVDTGNLRDNLVVDGPHRDGNFTYVIVGLPKSTDADTARYGTVQEYGAADTPARPYIRPAMDNGKPKARRAMVGVLKAALS